MKFSYLKVNIILFRCILIIASVFFILNAVFIGYIWIDVITYNFLMIVINFIYLIPLIKPYINIELNPIEQRVYERVFKQNIDKRTCKRILDSAKFFPISEKNFITQQGSVCSGVYLIGHIKNSFQLIFSQNQFEVYRENKNYTWLGLIEYETMRKTMLQGKIYKWPISIFLDKKKIETYDHNDEISKEYPEPMYVYFFELEKLQKLYEGENGTFVRNTLHSIWLKSLSDKILDINMKVVKLLGKEDKLIHIADYNNQIYDTVKEIEDNLINKSNIKENNIEDEYLSTSQNYNYIPTDQGLLDDNDENKEKELMKETDIHIEMNNLKVIEDNDENKSKPTHSNEICSNTERDALNTNDDNDDSDNKDITIALN